MIKFAIILVLAIYAVSSKDLPKYIHPCKFSDPDLSECLVKSGNEAIKGFLHGDKDLGIKPLVPILELPDVNINVNPNFQLLHTDIKIKSFTNLKLTSAKVIKEEKKFIFTLENPDFFVTTRYDMKIKFAGQEIFGKGSFNMSIVDTVYTIEESPKVEVKDGVKYYTIGTSTVDAVPKRIYFNFENLFNGDVKRGDAANKLIDENWLDFFKEVKPAYLEAIHNVIRSVITAFNSQVPKDELLLE